MEFGANPQGFFREGRMLEIVHGAFFNDYKAALLFLRRLEKIILLNKEQIGRWYFCI